VAGKGGSRGNVQKKRDLPRFLTYVEMDRLLLAIEDLEDLVAVRVMLYAGLRVAEALDLRVEDVNLEEMHLHVREGKGRKERYSPVDVHTLSFIRSFASERGLGPEDRLLSRKKRALQYRVEALGPRAGISRVKMGCHVLRHTCATWQLDQGIPLEKVKDNLGHEDISTTMIYTHLDIRQRVRTYQEVTRW